MIKHFKFHIPNKQRISPGAPLRRENYFEPVNISLAYWNEVVIMYRLFKNRF